MIYSIFFLFIIEVKTGESALINTLGKNLFDQEQGWNAPHKTLYERWLSYQMDWSRVIDGVCDLPYHCCTVIILKKSETSWVIKLVGIPNSMGVLQQETALTVVRHWIAMEFREESREVQDVFWIRDLPSLRRSNYVRETVLLF